jgi:large conductance mechanosensitive channel
VSRSASGFDAGAPQSGYNARREDPMLKEFKEFALRGNVVDMAVGIIIGGAFGTIARSLVDDVLMPPIGLLLGGVDFGDFFSVLKQGMPPGPYATLADARAAGAVTVNYGVFLQAVISFLVVAAAVFFLIRGINRMRRHGAEPPPPPTVKECPFCATNIPIKAKRCPQCTSQLA